MNPLMEKLTDPTMSVAIDLHQAETCFLEYQLRQGADPTWASRYRLEVGLRLRSRVRCLRQHLVALLMVSATPLSRLACMHCAAPTMGRPWHALPSGKGLCVVCIDLERQTMQGEPPLEVYGVEGVHCGACEIPDDANELDQDAGIDVLAVAPAGTAHRSLAGR